MENYSAIIFSGAIALIFLGLGLPLANNKVPPNRWYGYRVSRYQFEDDEVWYAINHRGGIHMVLAGIASWYTPPSVPCSSAIREPKRP